MADFEDFLGHILMLYLIRSSKSETFPFQSHNIKKNPGGIMGRKSFDKMIGCHFSKGQNI
jgi:hypothetical protein